MYDVDTLAALASGRLVIADLLTVDGWTNGGAARQFGFQTGSSDITLNVVPMGGGSPVSRNFVGEALQNVPPVIDAIGLEPRPLSLGLDHVSTVAGSPMDMVYGNNVRVARVELHRALFDPATWNLVATPHLLFAGRVDGASVDDAAAGGEGGLTLDAQSSAIDLTKINPAMESDEQLRLRGGDRFRRYGDTSGQIERWWGMVRGSAQTNNTASPGMSGRG